MKPGVSAGIRYTTRLILAATLTWQLAARAAEDVPALDTTAATEAAASAATTLAPSRISTELMRSIRAATFEVVLKKPQEDPLQYERPPPLELLPFAQRNDQYQPIGTAFAIGPGRFVTAAHVTGAASGSLLGTPALRDAQGNIHPIERVTRYSLHEDFIVFTVAGAADVEPLQTSTSFQIDTPVIAVGNALGEGIVARDGILTSETPEQQDGRWNWLRFSAPASPGNSGGPLLDAQGRVIGLIARKSANENLNYALPIGRVLAAPEGKAVIDSRYTVALPFMQARSVVTLDTSFDLPLSFTAFDQQLRAVSEQHVAASLRQLLQQSAADIFPRGKSSRLLADTFLTGNPAFILQQADGHWDVPRSNAGGVAQLGNDGSVWTSGQGGAMVFRVRYPADMDVAAHRGDGRLLGEQVLKSVQLIRTVATERVRITSLGAAGEPELIRDAFGRVWQQWQMPMPHADATLILAALPMPDGYVGFFRTASGSRRVTTALEMRLLMDLMHVSYGGTLAQWREFLDDDKLRPRSFADWKTSLDPQGEVSIRLPRLAMTVDRQVLDVTGDSVLSVFPGTIMDGDQPAWDALAVLISLERGRSPTIQAVRRARPAADAGQGTIQRWQDMQNLRGQFTGNPIRNANSGWARTVVGGEGTPFSEASFLYELTYTTPNSIQGEVSRAMPLLPPMFTVRER